MGEIEERENEETTCLRGLDINSTVMTVFQETTGEG
jgi:hypothetical protein